MATTLSRKGGMKMNIRQIILLLTATIILTGCSEDSQTMRSQQTALNGGKSLGSLQTREKVIRIETDGNFSIFELNGRTLALSLNKSEFQNKFPQLYRDYEKAVASGELANIAPDASLTTTSPEVLK
jgi:hypothetical protein